VIILVVFVIILVATVFIEPDSSTKNITQNTSKDKKIIKTANDKAPIAQKGEMQHKYRRLIEYAKNEDPRTKIYKETGDQITFGISGMHGTTLFKITQILGDVNVLWTAENTVFGNARLEWNFGKYPNEDKMMKDIKNDLKLFHDSNFGSVNDYLDKNPELKRVVESLDREKLVIFLENHPEHLKWFAEQADGPQMSEANTLSKIIKKI